MFFFFANVSMFVYASVLALLIYFLLVLFHRRRRYEQLG